jgi:hypothetical protein
LPYHGISHQDSLSRCGEVQRSALTLSALVSALAQLRRDSSPAVALGHGRRPIDAVELGVVGDACPFLAEGTAERSIADDAPEAGEGRGPSIGRTSSRPDTVRSAAVALTLPVDTRAPSIPAPTASSIPFWSESG